MSNYVWIQSRGTITPSAGGPSTYHLYVSPTGNDSNSGTSAAPLLTLNGARLKIASLGLAGNFPVQVNVKAGRYFDTNVTFGASDSGSSSYGIKFVSSDGNGQARIIGGTLASGWTLHSGSIYKVALASPCYTLYENGVRADMARYPPRDPGASYPCSAAPYLVSDGIDASYTQVRYKTGELDPTPWTLADTRIRTWGAFFSGQVDWFMEHAEPTAVDTVARTYTIGNGGMKFYGFSNPGGTRFFVEGPLQLLQGPGQFTCTGGFLYYWPRNTPIDSQEIIIPTRQSPISILGTNASTRAKYLTFQGFAIEATEFNSWYRYGTNGVAVEYDYFNTISTFRQGGIRMENCDHITIDSCHISNTGFAGIFMQGYNQSHLITNNWIEHTGTDGISVNGLPPGSGDVAKSNTFSNLKINNMGELDGSSQGIRLSQSGSNTVSYCNISNGPRKAIWIHGDYAVAAAVNYCQGNYIHHILATNLGQDSGDMGALTMSFLSSPNGGGSLVTQNRFSQCIVSGVNAHPLMLDPAPPNGVFGDNESSGQLCDNIQVSNTQGAFFRNNDSSGWVVTNCSFLTDGSVNPSFNQALMETSLIGTVAGFPY